MRVLVTGANGYLGAGVVAQLCDDGIEVVAADFSNMERVDKRAKRIQCDLFSIQEPYEFFNEPDVLLHMAWRNGFVHNDSSHIEDLPKHFFFINRMAESGCKQISVMGTMHEIGFYEGCIKEDTPTNPESLYGISKDALRRLVQLSCNKNNCLFQWLRGFYIVGNTETGASIFCKIVFAEKNGQKYFPFTSGINQYDFLDYSVFCKQVAATVEQSNVCGIINICSGQPERISERVERFIEENKYKIKLDYGKYPDRPYDSKAVWGDDKKIRIIMNNYKSNDE